MFFFKKKLTVPETNETKEIEVVKTWIVRWMARKGEYFSDRYPVAEVFTSEQQARDFYNSLINAYKLVKNSHDIHQVEIEENK